MKINHTIVVAIILAGLSSAAAADYYSQDFDSMGLTGNTFPAGWSLLNIAGDSSSLVNPTSAEMATATAGISTVQPWDQTQGANIWDEATAVNWGSTATDPNRLLGTSPTAVRGSILQLSLVNNSGAAVASVLISYDMKCMARGTLKDGYPANSIDELPGYSLYYLDGSDWLHVPSLDLANEPPVNTVVHDSAVLTYDNPVANGDTMYFRWYDDNAIAFSPDTLYAIDNVKVDVPEPTALSLLAVGALALISRRRKG